MTAVIMFGLAADKARTAGRWQPVPRTEVLVTLTDRILAAAVLLDLTVNAALGRWWADPAAGYVLVWYACREVGEILTGYR